MRRAAASPASLPSLPSRLPGSPVFVLPSGRLLPVWRADRLDAAAVGVAASGDTRPTGHAALDAELPGGGWPAAGLIELLLPAPGCGELRLLAPAFAHGGPAAGAAPWLWVAPPFTPYAPALAALGLAPDRLVIATPADVADAAWAAEQALRSGTLAAVLWWQSPERVPALPTALRRLHLAAEEGRTPLFALRPIGARAQSSPAPLRLALSAMGPNRLAVEVFKRRGPPMSGPLTLTLSGPPTRLPQRCAPRVPLPPENETLTPHAVVRPLPERLAA